MLTLGKIDCMQFLPGELTPKSWTPLQLIGVFQWQNMMCSSKSN